MNYCNKTSDVELLVYDFFGVFESTVYIDDMQTWVFDELF